MKVTKCIAVITFTIIIFRVNSNGINGLIYEKAYIWLYGIYIWYILRLMVVVLLVILCQWYYVDKMQDLLSHMSVVDNDKYQGEYWTGQGTQSSFDIIMWHIWHLVSGSKKVWLILIHLDFLLIHFAYFISMKQMKHIKHLHT